MKYLGGFLCLIYALASHPCTTANLLTEPKSPFNKIPVYDQDSVGICYAYAGAQLADYYSIKHGASGRNFHPGWLALTHSFGTHRNQLTGGSSYDTLTNLKKFGNCDYEAVSATLKNWANEAGSTEAEFLLLMERFAAVAKNNKKSQDLLALKKTAYVDSTAVYSSSSKLQHAQPAPEVFGLDLNKTLSLASFGIPCDTADAEERLPAVLAKLKNYNSDTIVEGLLHEACKISRKKPVNLPTPTNLLFNDYSQEKVISVIADHLKTSKSPLAVSYCSKFLQDGSYVGLEDDLFSSRLSSEKKSDCAKHESLIVGMKSKNNQCQVLIRNSWGSSFWPDTKGLKCLCKHRDTGAFVDDCTSKEHGNGFYIVEGCWVDSKQLSENTFFLTVLK